MSTEDDPEVKHLHQLLAMHRAAYEKQIEPIMRRLYAIQALRTSFVVELPRDLLYTDTRPGVLGEEIVTVGIEKRATSRMSNP